jgi:hypothetical protein
MISATSIPLDSTISVSYTGTYRTGVIERECLANIVDEGLDNDNLKYKIFQQNNPLFQ